MKKIVKQKKNSKKKHRQKRKKNEMKHFNYLSQPPDPNTQKEEKKDMKI